MAPDEGMLNQGAQAPQGGLRIRRISATPGHSLELGPDGAPAPRTGPEYAKLIDISRCIGCKGCEVACKEWNELGVEPTENFGSMQSHRDLGPDTWLLMRFNEIEVADDLQWLIKKDACLHCEEPGCLYACPAPGAIVQYENGIVDFNQEQCIGCQLCVSGCPFDIPRFKPETKKVYKCNMCIDRVEVGLEPACVATCPTDCRMWTDLNNPKDPVAQLVLSGRAKPLAEHLGTNPKVYYIAPSSAKVEPVDMEEVYSAERGGKEE